MSVPRNDSRRCPAINLNLVLSKESTAAKDVGTTVDKTTIPVYAEQTNQMPRCHSSPPVSVPRNDSQRCPAINLNLVLSKESTVAKDDGTTVDKTTIPV